MFQAHAANSLVLITTKKTFWHIFAGQAVPARLSQIFSIFSMFSTKIVAPPASTIIGIIMLLAMGTVVGV